MIVENAGAFSPEAQARWQLWAGERTAAANTLKRADYTDDQAQDFLDFNVDYLGAPAPVAPAWGPWVFAGVLLASIGLGFYYSRAR